MISSVEKFYYKEGSDDVWGKTYKTTFSNGDVKYVPHNVNNRHYQEILEWVADGNTITDNGGA